MPKVKIRKYLDDLQNVTDGEISIVEIATVLKNAGISSQSDVKKLANNLSNRLFNDGFLKEDEVSTLDNHYKSNNNLINDTNTTDSIAVTYLPEIYLSAGFGVENYNENQETMMIDAALLVSEKGSKINPKYCKIVRISGNSMSPEYRHGDRVIIDENDKELSDGQIFAFRYDGKCYVKEINLMGNRIKCISLNKDYDAFYVNDMAEITVLGRILPRIRL